jgi:hypothetical protein
MVDPCSPVKCRTTHLLRANDAAPSVRGRLPAWISDGVSCVMRHRQTPVTPPTRLLGAEDSGKRGAVGGPKEKDIRCIAASAVHIRSQPGAKTMTEQPKRERKAQTLTYLFIAHIITEIQAESGNSGAGAMRAGCCVRRRGMGPEKKGLCLCDTGPVRATSAASGHWRPGRPDRWADTEARPPGYSTAGAGRP